MDVDDSSDEDGDSGSTSSPSTRNKGYQRRPCGIEAAKLVRSEDAGMEKQVKASTAAVDKLTAVQQERTALCFLDSPAMRHTPEAAKYRKAVMQKMMASAGLAAASGLGVSPEPAKTSPEEDINVVELDDGVAALDVTPPPADATSSAPPAAASAAGANSPPGKDPQAASTAAGRNAAERAPADKAATPAAPATQPRRGATTNVAASRKPQSSGPPLRLSMKRSRPRAVSNTAASLKRRRPPPRTLSDVASVLLCYMCRSSL